jgi:hypothetical protein
MGDPGRLEAPVFSGGGDITWRTHQTSSYGREVAERFAE